MAQSGKDKRIADLFTKGSHHRNLSVIYIVQNVFHQGKEMRNISLNAHYIVLSKSPRDRQQISILARQVNPGRVQEFMKSYEKATILMLDLKPMKRITSGKLKDIIFIKNISTYSFSHCNSFSTTLSLTT